MRCCWTESFHVFFYVSVLLRGLLSIVVSFIIHFLVRYQLTTSSRCSLTLGLFRSLFALGFYVFAAFVVCDCVCLLVQLCRSVYKEFVIASVLLPYLTDVHEWFVVFVVGLVMSMMS